MPRLKITQIFRVERSIIIDVDAPSLDVAIDQQMDADAPSSDDPRWQAHWTLENEEIEGVTGA